MKFALFLFRTRVILLLATLSLCAVFLYRTFVSTAALTGVVCAPVTEVGAPLGGTVVANGALPLGARVRAGQLLLTLENQQFDEQALLDTRHALAQALLERERLGEQERRAGQRLGQEQRRLLDARAEQLDILRARLARDEHYLAEASVREQDLARQAERQQSLAANGFIAPISADSSKASWQQAMQRVSAQRSELEMEKRMVRALDRGAEIEDAGLPQLAAVRARVVALQNELRTLQPERDSAARRAKLLEQALTEQQALAQRLRSAQVRALADGVVVQAAARAGHAAQRGDALLAYASCERPHVMVALRQRVYAGLNVDPPSGATVSIGALRVHGKVVARSPTPFGGKDFFPAAQAVQLRPDSAAEYGYALIELSAPPAALRQSCPLGAVADVRFD